MSLNGVPMVSEKRQNSNGGFNNIRMNAKINKTNINSLKNKIFQISGNALAAKNSVNNTSRYLEQAKTTARLRQMQLNNNVNGTNDSNKKEALRIANSNVNRVQALYNLTTSASQNATQALNSVSSYTNRLNNNTLNNNELNNIKQKITNASNKASESKKIAVNAALKASKPVNGNNNGKSVKGNNNGNKPVNGNNNGNKPVNGNNNGNKPVNNGNKPVNNGNKPVNNGNNNGNNNKATNKGKKPVNNRVWSANPLNPMLTLNPKNNLTFQNPFAQKYNSFGKNKVSSTGRPYGWVFTEKMVNNNPNIKVLVKNVLNYKKVGGHYVHPNLANKKLFLNVNNTPKPLNNTPITAHNGKGGNSNSNNNNGKGGNGNSNNGKGGNNNNGKGGNNNIPKPPNNTPKPPNNTPKPPNNTPKPPNNTPKPPNNTPKPPNNTPKTPNNTPKPPNVPKLNNNECSKLLQEYATLIQKMNSLDCSKNNFKI